VFWLLTVLGWVLSTTLYGTTATLTRLVGLASRCTWCTPGAALAAVLPYDAVVETVVIARWLLRGRVAGVAIGAGVAGLYAVGARSTTCGDVLGLIPCRLVWLLAVQLRRAERATAILEFGARHRARLQIAERWTGACRRASASWSQPGYSASSGRRAARPGRWPGRSPRRSSRCR
jgi:hypothetical protein